MSLDHGCGAHSEAVGAAAGHGVQVPVIDELGYDLVDTAGVSMADTVFESFDHTPSADQEDDGSDDAGRFTDGSDGDAGIGAGPAALRPEA